MISDKRIQYFLDTNYNELKKNEYDELVIQFFEVKKKDWFQEYSKKNNDIKQEWNPKLVENFWTLIRIHVIPHMLKTKAFHFKNFVFPEFESSFYNTKKNNDKSSFDRTFWSAGNERSFEYKISFHNCEFLGNIDFSDTIFHQDLIFRDCEVNWNANFTKAKFKRALTIKDCSFYGDTIFHEAEILDNLSIGYSFFNGTHFNKMKVEGEFNLTNVNINGNFTLTEIEFSKRVDIKYSNFNHRSYFRKVSFNNKATFNACDFSQTYGTFFTDINLGGNCFHLNGCSFGDNTIFRRVDFKNLSLVQSNFENASFINCYWSFSKSRLVLEDENFIPDGLPDKLGELEVLYRLLKTNFEKKHSWELSGKAYISEMEMRRKSFITEKEYIQWFIYSFYKLAGYTQNFKRPLLLLLILTFFVFPLLYSDLCFLFYDHCYWSWEPLRKSLDASLPIFKLSFE